MKLVLGAAAALVLMAGVALAQTETPAPAAAPAQSACGDIPADPTVPDGATANAEQIQAFNTQYQAWGEAARTVLQCRRAEAQAEAAKAQSLLEQHNAAAQRINNVTNTWTTESQEFCARRGNRCTQQ